MDEKPFSFYWYLSGEAGHFIQAIAIALTKADDLNSNKIRSCWPQVWDTHNQPNWSEPAPLKIRGTVKEGRPV